MKVNLLELCCEKCQVTFWLSEKHVKRLRECHTTFYCPNGHASFYPQKSNAEKAKEDRDWYKKLYETVCKEKDFLHRSNSALRGVITRQKKKNRKELPPS